MQNYLIQIKHTSLSFSILKIIYIFVFFTFSENISAKSEFNLNYLHGDVTTEDVSLLSASGSLLPGEYIFSIFLNGENLQQEKIVLNKKSHQQVEPCISLEQLDRWGVITQIESGGKAPTQCEDLSSLFEGASVNFNGNNQRLDIHIPQHALKKYPNGYIPRSTYDQGVNALFINYEINGLHNSKQHRSDHKYYFGAFRTGINLNAWRLRYNVSLRNSKLENKNFTLEHNLESIRSRLLLGDTYTTNTVFDSFGFRGILITSDDEMLPYSQRSYAPIIRGIATSNARIEIHQDGILIYSINVAPGPFSIDDIVPNRLSGALDVSIIETDGKTHKYQQFFASAENMLRQGLWRYELSAGKVRKRNHQYNEFFIEGSLYYGLDNNLTPYTGLILSKEYISASIGLAKGLGQFGAISLDAVTSRHSADHIKKLSGQRYNLIYTKSFNNFASTFRLAAQHAPNHGYLSFNDVLNRTSSMDSYKTCRSEFQYKNKHIDEYLECPEQNRNYLPNKNFNTPKNRIDISWNQMIFNKFSLFLNMGHQEYHENSQNSHSVQIGLNGSYKNIYYGVYYFNSSSKINKKYQSLGINFSLPIGSFGHSKNNLNTSFSHSKNDGVSFRSGYTDTFLSDEQWRYSIDAGYSETTGKFASLGTSYQGQRGALNMNIESGENYHQLNFGARGGFILHEDGFNFSQEIQGASALIYAPGATGIGIENSDGSKVDSNNFALVSGLAAYRFNRVALRADNYLGAVDLSKAIANVVPTREAIIRVDFDTKAGKRFLIRSWMNNKKNIPLGAQVYDQDGLSHGLVGLNGEIFISSANEKDKLSVKWGDKDNQQCFIDLNHANHQDEYPIAGYQILDLPCLH